MLLFQRISFFIMLLPFVLQADIINVPADYDSIQGGINMANDGDTVLVADGTYFENINFKGKTITVASMFLMNGDTSHISKTIIDGSQQSSADSGSTVFFVSGEDSLSVLNGFTITGGTGTWFWAWGNTSQTHGGGILCLNSSPKLLNLIVKGNVAESSNGAGICLWNNSNALIEDVIVTENDGRGSASTNDASGGILCAGSSPILKRVNIFNNIGIMSGGVYCNEGSEPLLINVTLSGNKATGSDWFNDLAELVVWQGSHPVLINIIIWNDELNDILVRDEASSITITHSDINGGNKGIILENEGTVNWLDGNMGANPMFQNAANGDFRLRKGSPCIDSGVQDTLLVFNNGMNTFRIPSMVYTGSAPDIGAFEYENLTGIEKRFTIPTDIILGQNYPNPFNPTTMINYQLPVGANHYSPLHVELSVYNLLGQKVATLVNKKQAAGSYQVEWDATGHSNGIYMYSIETGEYREVKKMILLK